MPFAIPAQHWLLAALVFVALAAAALTGIALITLTASAIFRRPKKDR